MAFERISRHLVRKVDARLTFPLIALEALRELRALLDAAEAESILRARAMGATAEDIAVALGITRQGAYYKIKRAERRTENDVDDISVVLPETVVTHQRRP